MRCLHRELSRVDKVRSQRKKDDEGRLLHGAYTYTAEGYFVELYNLLNLSNTLPKGAKPI